MANMNPRGTHFNHAPNENDTFESWLEHLHESQTQPLPAPKSTPTHRGRRHHRKFRSP